MRQHSPARELTTWLEQRLRFTRRRQSLHRHRHRQTSAAARAILGNGEVGGEDRERKGREKHGRMGEPYLQTTVSAARVDRYESDLRSVVNYITRFALLTPFLKRVQF
jgi:hypothetical protein